MHKSYVSGVLRQLYTGRVFLCSGEAERKGLSVGLNNYLVTTFSAKLEKGINPWLMPFV